MPPQNGEAHCKYFGEDERAEAYIPKPDEIDQDVVLVDANDKTWAVWRLRSLPSILPR
jgi:hypothetical protein